MTIQIHCLIQGQLKGIAPQNVWAGSHCGLGTSLETWREGIAGKELVKLVHFVRNFGMVL